jgi:hypothetical protein
MNLGAGGGVRAGGILTPVKSVNIFPWKIEPSLEVYPKNQFAHGV